MATGKYSRVDGRKSSSYCSTVVVVVFVALCLGGVWILMSSSVVPVEKSNSSSDEIVNEAKQTVSENNSKQFEDSSGDLPEDVMKEDGNTVNSQNEKQSVQDDQVGEDGNKVEDNKDEKVDTESNDTKTDSETTVEENQDDKTESQEEAKKEADDNEKKGGEVEGDETNKTEQTESEEASGESKSETNEENKKTETGESADENKQDDKDASSNTETQEKDQASIEVFPAGSQSELLNETDAQNGAFSTQAMESQNEKKSQKSSISKDQYNWKLCNTTAGPDYIPCLDNWQAIRKLPSTKHYEHRERHCPEEAPTCLVPIPEGYKQSIKWPKSREKIWYYNVPHTKLAEVKGHQNWVKVTGEYLTFPGGGTQFKHGALHYIDFIQDSLPDIAWGKRTRVILDVGCGVASFGGYLFERDVIAMSFAPKDEHEAQVQFALERGIPAMSNVMGTKRLPFPSSVFDVVHCARCRVPWHIEGGKLLLELNRVLRPGGYFVWSATPVYQKLEEDVKIWKAMSELTKSMCWELQVIKKDTVNGVGAAIYRKPMSNDCYNQRSQNEPPLCKESDDPNAAWNVPLEACMHKVSEDASQRGSQWPEEWLKRLEKTPYWLLDSQVGIYGKAAPEDFNADYNHWKHVVSQSYMQGMGIDWSTVRNVMDMRAAYGGFAAALKDLKVWVMNVVPVDSPDTLPIIYERGLFGIYHDWCESFSTYPRTYDLLHADHLFSSIKKRCNLVAVMAEVDRILRPEGKLIVRDKIEIVNEVESMARSLHWEIRMMYSKDSEGLIFVRKTKWRPTEVEIIKSATL